MNDRFFPNAQFLWRFGHNNLSHPCALKIAGQVATQYNPQRCSLREAVEEIKK